MAKKSIINAIMELLNESFKDDFRVNVSNNIEKEIIDTFEKLAHTNMKLTDVNEKIIDLCLNNIKKEKENVNRVTNNFNKNLVDIKRYIQATTPIERISGISEQSTKNQPNKSTGITAVLKDATKSGIRGANNFLSREMPFYNLLKTIGSTIGNITKVLLPTRENITTRNMFSDNVFGQGNAENTVTENNSILSNISLGLNKRPLNEIRVMNNSVAGIAAKYIYKKLLGQNGLGGGFLGGILGNLLNLLGLGGFLGFFKNILRLPKKMFSGIKSILKAAYQFIRHPIQTLRKVHDMFKSKVSTGLNLIKGLIDKIKKIPTTIKNLPNTLKNIPSKVTKRLTPKFLRKGATESAGKAATKTGSKLAGKVLAKGGAKGTAKLFGNVGKFVPGFSLLIGTGTNYLFRNDAETVLGKDTDDISSFDRFISASTQTLLGTVGEGDFLSRLLNAFQTAAMYGMGGGGLVGAGIGFVGGFIGGDTLAKGIVKIKDYFMKDSEAEKRKDLEDKIFPKNKKAFNDATESLKKFNKDLLYETNTFGSYMYKGAAKYSDIKRFINGVKNRTGESANFNTDITSDVLLANKNVNQRLIDEGKLDVSKIQEYTNLSKVGIDKMLQTNPLYLEKFLLAVEEYNKKTNSKLLINEAARSYEEQAKLYQKYLQGGTLAAKPGTSQHEKGLALDISQNNKKFEEWVKIANKYGLYQNIKSEAWHFELMPEYKKQAVQIINNELDYNNKKVEQTPQPNTQKTEGTLVDLHQKYEENDRMNDSEYNRYRKIMIDSTAENAKAMTKQSEAGLNLSLNSSSTGSQFNISDSVFETIFGNTFALNTNTNIAV